jgi:UDP-N-acetylglucosamine enolpyruvyl transferase
VSTHSQQPCRALGELRKPYVGQSEVFANRISATTAARYGNTIAHEACETEVIELATFINQFVAENILCKTNSTNSATKSGPLNECSFGVLCLIVSGGLLASTSLQSVPDVIRAKKFEVVNDEGQTLVLLSQNKAGGSLEIKNAKNKILVQLTSHLAGEGKIITENGNGDNTSTTPKVLPLR